MTPRGELYQRAPSSAPYRLHARALPCPWPPGPRRHGRRISCTRRIRAGESAMSRAPGSSVGPFQIVSVLGRGGMGAVYLARDAQGAEVAVKTLDPLLARDLKYLERFRREARAATAVKHANVVRCFGSGEDANGPWIV